MDEEVEDIIGEIKYTDSQKSVATSNQYSLDFTDSSSDKNNSSGKDTYTIEWDSEDSDKNFTVHDSSSVLNLKEVNFSTAPAMVNVNIQYESTSINRSACTSLHKCSMFSQETFTQTSKTIIELAENEGGVRRVSENNTLETQTSFISITGNKTVEYRIEVSTANNNFKTGELISDVNLNNNVLLKKPAFYNITCNPVVTESESSKDDGSLKFLVSETDNEGTDYNESGSPNNRIVKVVDDISKENILSEHTDLRYENTSDFDSTTESDAEEDSLRNNCIKRPLSPDSDLDDLREKLIESDVDVRTPEKFGEPDIRRFGNLTPLTEESYIKKDSIMDITPNMNSLVNTIKENDEHNDNNEILFTSNAGMKVKLLKDDENKSSKDLFKLPPIHNQSCPNSPHLNSLFCKSNGLNKSGTLPCLYEGGRLRDRDSLLDRWEIGTKELASGEGALISGKNGSKNYNGPICLPPIHAEGYNTTQNSARTEPPAQIGSNITLQSEVAHDAINIKDRIKELKMSTKHAKSWTQTKYSISRTDSRSNSPCSASSPDEHRLCDVADRGCETLCVELVRRLRSSSWYEVIDTLEEIPKVLQKFWGIITENRIADLIRQVNAHIESPRPQVARCACTTLAAILKNTNYTKKPDFYESITILLIKTGSYSRPVRRAANVALDDIVCGVELSHAVTALCIHGATHKSALVRCASARLLVVCCALAGGGRDLLRTRPASAVNARRHTLRSLAALLEDKSTDTRKYAERLYSMLRPLTNFEAYYLTDVDVELASRQMKKYDQMLLCGPPKEVR